MEDLVVAPDAAGDQDGARTGKYTVDVRGAKGVQIGDHATQHNTFSSPTT